MPEVLKTVGRYEILREVGRGGMAMVYLARQTDLDRFVALKELGAFHASDPSFAQRFLRESRVAGSLRKRSEEHTSELQSHSDLVCRLLLEKKKKKTKNQMATKKKTKKKKK